MLVMDILLVLAFVFIFFFFFFNDTATTEIYTLSLHDALPRPARALLLWRSRLRQPCSSRLQTTATAGYVSGFRRPTRQIALRQFSQTPAARRFRRLLRTIRRERWRRAAWACSP